MGLIMSIFVFAPIRENTHIENIAVTPVRSTGVIARINLMELEAKLSGIQIDPFRNVQGCLNVLNVGSEVIDECVDMNFCGRQRAPGSRTCDIHNEMKNVARITPTRAGVFPRINKHLHYI
jgi:hypothetical protein